MVEFSGGAKATPSVEKRFLLNGLLEFAGQHNVWNELNNIR